MKRFSKLQWCGLALALAVFGMMPLHAQTAADLLNKFPVQSSAERDAACAELVRLGAPAVQEICAALLPSGDDAKARFALSGLVNYVMRAGAETERAMVAQALIDALNSASDKEIQAFLISELQLAGKDEAVAPLKAFLADDRLFEPAIRALQANPSPAAITALAEALPGSVGAPHLSLVKALGDLRCGSALPVLLADAAGEDATLRRAALYALANIGAPEAEPLLIQAAQAQEPCERSEMTNFLLRYAERRAELADAAACEKICRMLLTPRSAPQESNIPCAALSVLVSVKGKDAMGDLLDAMDSPDKDFRCSALRLAKRMEGAEITKQWVKKLKKSSPDIRPEIIAMLGDRRDTIGVLAVLDALKDPNAATRLAAIDAAARIGGPKVLPAFIKALIAATDPSEIAALKQALLQLPGEKVTDSVEAALLDMPSASRAAGIEIIAARRAAKHLETIFDLTGNADPVIRNAALTALGNLASGSDIPQLIDLLLSAATEEDRAAAHQSTVAVAKSIAPASQQAAAIIEALQKVSADRKAALLNVLVDVEGDAALHSVAAETDSADAVVKAAAVAALAKWHDVSATTDLLRFAAGTQDAALRDTALTGYVRLARTSPIAAEDKIWLYAQGFAALSDPACRKALLEGLADVNTLGALKQAAALLDDPALQTDAAAACARIVLPKNKDDAGLKDPATAPFLQKAAPLIADNELRARLEAHIAALPPAAEQIAPQVSEDESGFVPLFNGKDLTGWKGDLRGYAAEFGKLVCKETSHLNLFTEKPYGNFIFRFEFKLAPGANNGIGLRTPMMSHAAYDGMEIQILDDSAEQYKDLHEYQFNGSIYGVVPAERGHVQPAGEWNTEEIIAQGRQITVKVNGATVVDVNLDQATANGTPDGKEHPGLKNDSGHIALLGHGSCVEFRNLRIKELN